MKIYSAAAYSVTDPDGFPIEVRGPFLYPSRAREVLKEMSEVPNRWVKLVVQEVDESKARPAIGLRDIAAQAQEEVASGARTSRFAASTAIRSSSSLSKSREALRRGALLGRIVGQSRQPTTFNRKDPMNVLDVFDALNKLTPEERQMILDRFTKKAEPKRKIGRPKKVVVPAPVVELPQVLDQS